MGTFKDLTGKKINHFYVIEQAPYHIRNNGKKVIQWKCKCDCGEIRILNTRELTTGKRKSCGCMHSYYSKINATIHGESHTRLHNTWSGMRERCYTTSDYHYKWYGGRGIKMCDEWKYNYVAFRDWALENGYEDSLTIDRIDVDGDYCPENCRWVTMKQQSNNTRRNHYIEAFGERLTISQWSDKTGLPYSVIKARIKHGWTSERALRQPIRRNVK